MMKTCVYLYAGCSLINTFKRIEMKSLRSLLIEKLNKHNAIIYASLTTWCED